MIFDKTINMFIFGGNPNGRIMCEFSNWNGRVYKIARNELSMFAERNDCQNTGIYFLFGNDIDKGETVYIGEAERMLDRLKQHLKDNEYWNECIVVISKDNHLNKAHIKYMENKFYLLAKNIERYAVTNASVPTCSSVSEYDKAMLDEFIEHTKLLVNTLGKKVFDEIINSSSQKNDDNSIFYIKAARGADASGIIVADGFAVFKGSIIAESMVPSMPKTLQVLRQKLIDNKIVDMDNKFTKDYVFTSPSLAASIIMGRSANGKTEWKNKNGSTINDMEIKE